MKVVFGKSVVCLLALLFAADVALRFIPADRFTFRAWEAVSLYHGKPGFFEPNQKYFNARSSGDLAHIGNYPKLRQFRPESFTTDGCGNRNAPDIFEGEPASYLLLGDSFIAGSGVDDDHTLAAQLHQQSGMKVYNAGGADVDQAGWVLALAKKLRMGENRQGTVVLEYLERSPTRPRVVPDYEDWIAEAATLCHPKPLWQTRGGWLTLAEMFWSVSPLEVYSRNLLQRVQNDVLLPNSYKSGVVRETLSNGTPILFFPEEVDQAYAKRDEETPIVYWAQFAERMRAANLKLVVLFVPNKYTVYYPLLREPLHALPPLENRQYLDHLEGRLAEKGIPAVNLKNEFTAAAEREYREGRYIYWLDDTHWNAEGIGIAAKAILDKR